MNLRKFSSGCLVVLVLFLSIAYCTSSVHAATVTYLIHGPYYESGTLDTSDTVVATLYQPNDVSLSHTFSVSSTLWSLTLNTPATSITWNLTNSYNYTRIYYFTNALSDEVYLYIPNPGMIYQQYAINTIILGGLTNAYTSTLENVNGTNRIIERQPVDVINALPFWLTMYNQYSLKISSDQGTWTWNLPADIVQTKTYTITADMINATMDLHPITLMANATRTNGTIITVYYNDPSAITSSVTTQITHLNLGAYVTDYVQTDYGSIQTLIMTNATSSTSYIANITAVRSTGTQTWQIPIPADSAPQVWGTTFDILGSWPIPSYQLPAMFVTLLFFGIGNWRDSEAVCLLAIIVMGFLQVIGWGYFPAPGMAMAAMVVVLIYIHKGKEGNAILES